MKKGNKVWKKNGFALGTIVVVVLVLVSVTYLSGNYLYSAHYSYDGTVSHVSKCESCNGIYTSSQFTYGSNSGTWYATQDQTFPMIFRVNDMINPDSYGNDYSEYHIVFKDLSTGTILSNIYGSFPTEEFVETQDIYYNYKVTKEHSVELTVYLKQYNGVWVESYYYQTITRPIWTFKIQSATIADIDKDGKPDSKDSCPTLPETYNGYLDDDGCPDTVPSTTTVIPTDNPNVNVIVTPGDSDVSDNSLPSGSDDSDDTSSVDDDDLYEGDSNETHPWLTEGIYEGDQVLSGVFPTIIYPEKTLLANANYQFKSPATLYFEGAGPDESQTSHITTDPNYTNPLNPWWRGVADVTNLETVGYAWDIDSDGEADYTTKSFEHEFVVSEADKTKVFQIMFRVKMKSTTSGEYFWSMPVQMNIKVYAEGAYSIWDVPCAEYGSNLSPILQPIASVYCYISKAVVIAFNLPLIIISNIWYTMTEVLCIGSYEGFWANSVPLIVFVGFLLLMLIPDNIIEFAGASALAYLLGTTAPVVGLSTIPLMTAIGSVAIPVGITSVGLFSSANLGSLSILLIFFGLAVFQIIFGEGTQSFTKTNILGDPKTKTSTMVDVRVNVAGSSGMDKARTVFADAVIVLSVLMIAECKLGIPIYSAVWKLIWLIPDILMTLAKTMGGAL